jgi:hypothetical protein
MFGNIVVAGISIFALSKFLPLIGIEDGFFYWVCLIIPAVAMIMYLFGINDDA